MFGLQGRTVWMSVLLLAFVQFPLVADDFSGPPYHSAHHHPSVHHHHHPAYPGYAPMYRAPLDAPLYPAPAQNIPDWVGGARITNQALAPHEMLHRHRYNALMPPYSYTERRRWTCLPLLRLSNRNVRLHGTEVNVNYRTKHRMLSGFVPPR